MEDVLEEVVSSDDLKVILCNKKKYEIILTRQLIGIFPMHSESINKMSIANKF